MKAPDRSYHCKIADTEAEFDQIAKLNYQTFVKEIPQHSENSDQRLIDKFHTENTYLICLQGGALIGMMALRDQRPFSLDAKLEQLDEYLPKNRKVVEIRLLSVVPRARTGRVLLSLLRLLVAHNREQGWDLAVISGSTRQTKLYHHLGFKSFGPLVGTEGAYYQPMYIELSDFEKHTLNLISPPPVRFLPGPVNYSDDVIDAFSLPSIYHRSNEFREILGFCEDRLCHLTHANHVLIAQGSGTLANEMIAAQLRNLGKSNGIILTNGEFGERLVRQAERFHLSFDHVQFPWGEPIVLDTVNPGYDWLWTTACETSTGMKNDIGAITDFCTSNGIKACFDAVSAIGAYPLELSDVYLASGASGKALGSFPGLALVFHRDEIEPSDDIPTYLDIGLYYHYNKVPFTLSSNLVQALAAALRRFSPPSNCFRELSELSTELRASLLNSNLPVLLGRDVSSPAVFTIPLPPNLSSIEFGIALREENIEIASESDYLRERNWVQLCLMGDVPKTNLDKLSMALTKVSEVFGF